MTISVATAHQAQMHWEQVFCPLPGQRVRLSVRQGTADNICFRWRWSLHNCWTHQILAESMPKHSTYPNKIRNAALPATFSADLIFLPSLCGTPQILPWKSRTMEAAAFGQLTTVVFFRKKTVWSIPKKNKNLLAMVHSVAFRFFQNTWSLNLQPNWATWCPHRFPANPAGEWVDRASSIS